MDYSETEASTDILRIGVVGLGYWGPNLVRNLVELDGAEVAHLCDLRTETLANVSRRYRGISCSTDVEAVLGDPSIDAVAIATPVASHYDLALAALRSGKHVFVEKPLAASSEQARHLIDEAERRNLVLMPGHTFLYSPPVMAIKDLIAGGTLGTIYFISTSRVNLGLHQPDVSVVWDLAPHDFSILRYWLDELPEQVSAASRNCILPGTPDVAFIDLAYPSGTIAHVELSWLAPSKLRRTAIVGSEKMVVYDDTSSESVRIFDSGASLPDPETFGEYRLSYRTGGIVSPRIEAAEPLSLELADFRSAILDGTPLRSSPRVGLDVVRTIEAVDSSLASGGLPVALRDAPLPMPRLDEALTARATRANGSVKTPVAHAIAQVAQLEGNTPSLSALTCSVGIMAYNEEGNIANAIETILGQELRSVEIAELIVVASGCTDQTAAIVAGIARRDSRVHLIVQERREGKAAAINLFIGAARSPILLMVGADVLVKEGAIDALVEHLNDPAVGMVGGHPIPVNDEMTFLGHAVHLLWRLHDQVARQSPKLGEIVAFRSVIPSIPWDTAVDEISIQALIAQLGYQLVYEPRAIVYNRGPTTVSDFLRQRRRIYAGHLRIRKQQAYAASTMSVWRVGRALLSEGWSFKTPRTAAWTLFAVALEAIARALGYYDTMRRRSHRVWKTVTTTKRHIAAAMKAEAQQNVLVFRIVDFHQQQLELGVRANRQLAQAILHRIRSALGSNATVSAQQDGTIIAILNGDREESERAVQSLVEELATNPFTFNGHRDAVLVRLTCGMIAFSSAGQPLARSITDSSLEDNLAAASAG